MKSRTSFFDQTVLKKDITRFAPLWGLYLIGGLLVALTSGVANSRSYYLADGLGNCIGPMSVISICYAALAAQLLFGDLFNTRLCNALHAMPLRREGWFFTHVTAGLLFSVVPNAIISLALMLFLGEFWYTALLWLLGMTLHYLFFFGLAVFCMMLTGNRFASAAVYAIINFFSMIVMWFSSTVFGPLMYGVVIRTEGFSPFSPVVKLCSGNDYLLFEHDLSCPCVKNGNFHEIVITRDHVYRFYGLMTESWVYLIILAAIGIGLGAAALVLYRKRHLESAGDFVAFKSIRPVFTLVYTLCVGAVLQIFGNLLEETKYIFLLIGLIIGYFTSQMLLSRSLRVFQKKNWIHAALILALVFGSVGLCKIDAFGIVRWTPDASDVVSIKVADSRVTEFRPNNTDAEFLDKASIEKLISIHELLHAEGAPADRLNGNGVQNVTICYTLKDGREVYRQYKASRGGEALRQLDELIFCNPVALLRASTLEQLLSSVYQVSVENMDVTGASMNSLLSALWADGQAGTLRAEPNWTGATLTMGYVKIYYKDGASSGFYVTIHNKHTASWIEEDMVNQMDLVDLFNNVSFIAVNGAELTWEDGVSLEMFLRLFYEERNAGLIPNGKEGKGYQLEIYFYNINAVSYTVPEQAAQTFAWIVQNMRKDMVSGK